jgi:hypothetical protein
MEGLKGSRHRENSSRVINLGMRITGATATTG